MEFLIDDRGNEQRSEASKGEVALDYFRKLFTSSNPDNFNDLFHDLMPRVTDETNKALIRLVTKEEVNEAIFLLK